MMDITFERSPLERLLDTLCPGDRVSGLECLKAIEDLSQEEAEEALLALEEHGIALDISDLPAYGNDGEAAVRLKLEQKFAKSGHLQSGLDENDPLRLYLEELAQVPACGDMKLLSQQLLEGDRSVTQSITNLMLGRVVELAREMTGRGVLLLDLIQEGSLGLWQAILNYEGGDLEAQCHRQIRWDLARAVTVQARERGVGQKLRQAMEDYRAVDERLLSELGRNPTPEEIAEAMHISVEEVAAVAKNLEAARTLAQAKQPAEPEQEEAEDRQAVEDTAYFQMRQRIAELLSELNDQEKTLLTLRFGLEGGKPLTAEQVGARLGLTAEEAVRMEAAVLAKLRHE